MGLLDGLGSYLFGIKPVDDSQAKADAEAQRKAAAAYAAREANAYGGQQRLANNLWGVVNGQGPSVAGTELQQGLDANLAAGNSMAAGGSGANGALNRYAAILAAGKANVDTNQQAALLQAQQTAQARQQLSGVTGAMAGESGSLAQSSNANDLAALGLAAGIDESNQKSTAAVDGALLGGISSLGAAGLTAGMGVGAPVAAVAPTAAATAGSLYSASQPGYSASTQSYGANPSYGSLYSAAQPGLTASRLKPEDDGYSGGPYGGGGYGNPYGDRY